MFAQLDNCHLRQKASSCHTPEWQLLGSWQSARCIRVSVPDYAATGYLYTDLKLGKLLLAASVVS